jgi:hypothetical protein
MLRLDADAVSTKYATEPISLLGYRLQDVRSGTRKAVFFAQNVLDGTDEGTVHLARPRDPQIRSPHKSDHISPSHHGTTPSRLRPLK